MAEPVKGWLAKPMAKIEKSSSQLNVLYGESDSEVIASQAVTLQKAGYQVQTAVGRKGVEDALRQSSFDLVILGPTLTRNDRHHLPYMVKKVNMHTKVMVMHTDGERHPYVDGNIDTGRTMEDMIARIAHIMPQAQAAKAKAAGAK